MLPSPKVISLDTVAELAAASCPNKILFDPVVRSFVPVLPASVPIIVLLSPVLNHTLLYIQVLHCILIQ